MTARTAEATAALTITLADGRKLAYAQFGAPDGRPVFAFPGFGASRMMYSPFDGLARKQGVRLISVDRPGLGESTFQPNRKLTDWPADLAALADALGLPRFAVMGASGGGPYVAACAFRMPERLTAAAIVSGVGPIAELGTKGMMTMNRTLFGLYRYAPLLADVMVWLMKRMNKDTKPEEILKRMGSMIPEADRRVYLEHPDITEVFYNDFRIAQAHGSRGIGPEGRIYVRPWGFRLEDISMPVHLWQGDADVNVPLSHGEYQARALPHGTLHLCPGEGHLLMIDHLPEILDTLAPAQ